MLFASPQAGARLALRLVTGVGAGDPPVIKTTSGAWLNARKIPALVGPSLAAESEKLKMPEALNAPSADQRGSILPFAGSSVAIALLPPTNSLKRIFLSGSQVSHAAEAFMSLVRFFASPPLLLTMWMSPPVMPSSLIKPSMKAICLPSGDQAGLAICSLGL